MRKIVTLLVVLASSLLALAQTNGAPPDGPVMSYRLLDSNDAWRYGTIPMYAFPQNGGLPIIGPSNLSDTGTQILYKGQPISVSAGVQSVNDTQGAIHFISGAQIVVTPTGSGNFTIGFTGPGFFPQLTTWDVTLPYVIGNIVLYQGIVYSAIANGTSNLPTNNSFWVQGVPTSSITIPATSNVLIGSGTPGIAQAGRPNIDYTTPAGNVATASALFAAPSRCGAGLAPTGIDIAGNAIDCTPVGAMASIPATLNVLKGTNVAGIAGIATPGVDYLLPNGSAALLTSFPTLNQNTTGQANTALALASAPTRCNLGFAPQGIDASGNALLCAPINGGVGSGTVGNGSRAQAVVYGTATQTVQPNSTLFELDNGMSLSDMNSVMSAASAVGGTVIIPDGVPQLPFTNSSAHIIDMRQFMGYTSLLGKGAICDARESALNIVITSGSNVSNVGALLSTADVGKTFFFFNKSGYAYGLTQSVWTAKALSYSFPNMTWSANAPFSQNSQVYYGTDSSTAIAAVLASVNIAFPLNVPSGCLLLSTSTIMWNNNQIFIGRNQRSGGFVVPPGMDTISTQDSAGGSVSAPGTGAKAFSLVVGTEVDWSLGYNKYAADGTLTVIPPVYRPLYDHSGQSPTPFAPGWMTNGALGVSTIVQNSAVICTPNAYAPPDVGRAIMFPYFANIFSSTVISTAGSCSAGLTARTLNNAFPNTSIYNVSQAEWFTATAFQSTTTTIPASGITYPLTLNLTLSTDPIPGWISNFPQHGHIKLCGSEFDYLGTSTTTMVLRKGPTTSNGCSGTTLMAVMNMCAAKNLFGSSSDQPWPVVPSINAGNSTPSGANWFPGQCGGNFGIAFPTANGNTYVGGGLAGGFLDSLYFAGTGHNGTGNANNAGAILVQANNAFFSTHVSNLITSNLQYDFVQGPASAGQHGVGSVGPTGIGNTFHNLWFFGAFPISFVDMQSSDLTDLNMNSAEIDPYDGTAIGAATCIHFGYTLDEQTGGTVTFTQWDAVHPYACEPENGTHKEVLWSQDIEGSHISFDSANFEGIPSLFSGDHLKLTNTNVAFPTVNYGNSNDFGTITGNAMPYITDVWNASSAQFYDWGANTHCLLTSFSAPPIPCVNFGRSSSEAVKITPAMWNNNGALDPNPMTTTGAVDLTAPYWGSSATCNLGGAKICTPKSFYSFNGFMFIGQWNLIAPTQYVIDATVKTTSAPTTFTLQIQALDSGSGTCSSGSFTVVAQESVTTTTAFGPIPPLPVNFAANAGCIIGVQFYSGSTTDTLSVDKFNFVPVPKYVPGPVVAPTYPGSCAIGIQPSSYLGTFSGFSYFCDGGTVHRNAVI